MTEKNNLDKRITSSMSYQSEMAHIRDKKKTKDKVINFNKKATSCENFMIKQGELKVQTFWCKITNQACTYCHCPNKVD